MSDITNRFQIFGRTEYETPLTFIKEITVQKSVTDEALAAVGNEAWVELIAMPTSALLHVTGGPSND